MFYGFNFGPFCVPLNGQSWDMTPSQHNLSRKLFEGFENWAWTQMQKVGTKYEKKKALLANPEVKVWALDR